MRTAVYHYKTYDFQGGFRAWQMRVEIVGETAKSYKVRYLEPHANGTRPGAIAWVRKTNITPKVRPAVNDWLPYKD